jgi:hypothetical protein
MIGYIVELIGEDAAARLVARFGGTRLYVPHLPSGNDVLVDVLGVDAALKLARIFGGERIELPKPPPRRARIVELRAAGHSVQTIAQMLGCTRRRVLQVLADARCPAAALKRRQQRA